MGINLSTVFWEHEYIIFILCQISEKVVSKNQELHLICTDLEKAYNSVPISEVWNY